MFDSRGQQNLLDFKIYFSVINIYLPTYTNYDRISVDRLNYLNIIIYFIISSEFFPYFIFYKVTREKCFENISDLFQNLNPNSTQYHNSVQFGFNVQYFYINYFQQIKKILGSVYFKGLKANMMRETYLKEELFDD